MPDKRKHLTSAKLIDILADTGAERATLSNFFREQQRDGVQPKAPGRGGGKNAAPLSVENCVDLLIGYIGAVTAKDAARAATELGAFVTAWPDIGQVTLRDDLRNIIDVYRDRSEWTPGRSFPERITAIHHENPFVEILFEPTEEGEEGISKYYCRPGESADRDYSFPARTLGVIIDGSAFERVAKAFKEIEGDG